jgi:phosphoglycerate kinase
MDVDGKVVFCRVDFNVPLDGERITDDRRIRAALPTLQLLAERGARVLCASHLGRPKGQRVAEMSLRPAARRLAELLEREVPFAEDCVGEPARELADKLPPGGIGLLENLRFHAGETKGDMDFARQLAAPADVYVNDAFGAAHRAHASVVGVPEVLGGGVAGLLMDQELKALGRLAEQPERPYVAILGGAKVSDKIQLIERLLDRVDVILVGGAMAYTFLAARDVAIGSSLVESDKLDLARQLERQAGEKSVRIELPVDHVVAGKVEKRKVEDIRTTEGVAIPDGTSGVDIGPQTLETWRGLLGANVRTVLWNGPVGLFEAAPSAAGTKGVAEHLAGMQQAFRVLGGGDTAAAAAAFGLTDRYDHVSTGGGAALELLSGVELPGVKAIEEKR